MSERSSRPLESIPLVRLTINYANEIQSLSSILESTGQLSELEPTMPTTIKSPSTQPATIQNLTPPLLELRDNSSKLDDKNGDLVIKKNMILNSVYFVECLIGTGSFGKVVRATNQNTSLSVAIKIIKNRKPFYRQGLIEWRILEHLKKFSSHPGYEYIVKPIESFDFNGHLCIVFELLTFNLYDLLYNTDFNGVSLNLTCKFAWQLLHALSFLGTVGGVIHCDLKPENILLINKHKSAIKIIDFGSSCLTNERIYTYIQSRFYRAPEIVLELNYSPQIDLWSVGCIIYEMHTGQPLFGGKDETELLGLQIKLLGMPPEDMILKSKSWKKFFSQDPEGRFHFLYPPSKDPGSIQNRKSGQPPTSDIKSSSNSSHTQPPPPTVSYISTPSTPENTLRQSQERLQRLKYLLNSDHGGPNRRRWDFKLNQPQKGHEKENYVFFSRLILSLLEWRPSDRSQPSESLLHKFFHNNPSTKTDAFHYAVTGPSSSSTTLSNDIYEEKQFSTYSSQESVSES